MQAEDISVKRLRSKTSGDRKCVRHSKSFGSERQRKEGREGKGKGLNTFRFSKAISFARVH